MKNKFLLVVIFILSITLLSKTTSATELYSKAYGKSSDPAVIFLHGGPGYNSFSFEVTSAQKLADAGYYVIVYDQTGCGRSKQENSTQINPQDQFNFRSYSDDLLNIYNKYNLKKSILLGHSWGAALAIKFAILNPEKVGSIVLASAPLHYQSTYRTILSRCRKIYETQKSPQLQYINMLEKMDTTSLQYSSYTLMHAMNCGLYIPKTQVPEAVELYQQISASVSANLASQMEQEVTHALYNNEKYTLLNLYQDASELQTNNKIKIAAIYGAEDGLFDETQLKRIEKLTGVSNFVLIPDASHNIFIDRQTEFIAAFRKLTSKN